jgi:hypothetical protein
LTAAVLQQLAIVAGGHGGGAQVAMFAGQRLPIVGYVDGMPIPGVPFGHNNHDHALALVGLLVQKAKWYRDVDVEYFPNGQVKRVSVRTSTGVKVALVVLSLGVLTLVIGAVANPVVLDTSGALLTQCVKEFGKEAVLLALGVNAFSQIVPKKDN